MAIVASRSVRGMSFSTSTMAAALGFQKPAKPIAPERRSRDFSMAALFSAVTSWVTRGPAIFVTAPTSPDRSVTPSRKFAPMPDCFAMPTSHRYRELVVVDDDLGVCHGVLRVGDHHLIGNGEV